MITGNHPRRKWILISPPYVHSFIWMTMQYAISQRWHEYGGPSWICQNRPSVFAHYGYLDLLVSPLCICQTQLSAFADKWYQLFFWSSVGFLPKKVLYFPSPIICIFIQVISTFVRACCFLHCSSIRFHPSKPFSLNTSCWVIDGCCFPFFNKQFATV